MEKILAILLGVDKLSIDSSMTVTIKSFKHRNRISKQFTANAKSILFTRDCLTIGDGYEMFSTHTISTSFNLKCIRRTVYIPSFMVCCNALLVTSFIMMSKPGKFSIMAS